MDGLNSTETVYGNVIPKVNTTVAFGTGGYYLTFDDNSAATSATLGKDYSGNGNDWTPNNLSVTAGTSNDSVIDFPVNSTTERGNYCVWNPLWQGRTNDPVNGNLNYPASSVGLGSIGMSSGSYYWEITSTGGTSTVALYNTAATSSIGVTSGNTYGFRYNASAGTFDYTTNGSSFTSIATGLTTKPYFIYVSTAVSTTATLNCGQQAFTYSVPSGYKAFGTQNMSVSYSSSPRVYVTGGAFSGNSTARDIIPTTTYGSIQPDLVWVKSYTANTYDHKLIDSVRGTTLAISSNTTSTEATEASGLTAFLSNGFSLGTDISYNVTGTAYQYWMWRAGGSSSSNTSGTITSTVSVNQAAGFSVVTYTGTGANATVGHGLGVAPKMIIVKRRNSAVDWVVYHSSMTSAAYYMNLNLSQASASQPTVWNSTAPTSSVFSVGTNSTSNASGGTYVAYCWAEVEGLSKMGSYTGNGSADGPYVYCGFFPSFILIKSSTGAEDWTLSVANSLSGRNGFGLNYMVPDTNALLVTNPATVDTYATGFKIKGTTSPFNTSGATYVYMAFSLYPVSSNNRAH